MQESFGWLATLLNDRYGQHHIQESGFHKSCYDCFLSNNIPQPDSPQQGNTNTSYHQGYSSSKIPTHRTAVPLTTPLQNSPQNQTDYRQNEFHSTLKASYLASDSANFTNRGISDKQSVINRMMRDPSGFPNLNYDLKNDEDVVAAALSGQNRRTTEQTIHKIRSSVGIDAAFNKEVRTKVKEKYPNFFQEQTFNGSFPNFFHHDTFQGFPSSNTQKSSKQTPQDKAPIKWPEPDDLKAILPMKQILFAEF